MNKKEQMTVAFITALTDVFKNKDERELDCIPKLEDEGKNGNDLILAIFYAFQFVFNTYTGQECDSLKFISILTRLLFQEHQDSINNVNEEENENA